MDNKNILSRIKEIETELQNLKLQLTNESTRPTVGDLVEILNPKRGQETTGRISKIGRYITVQTKKGKVVRSFKNIRVVQENK
mmetsp:Transcript_14376/g.26998  ORF Transcript_14376/g.26998 Transcript_14376/m.26998 type:complete len:83 (+) Transcript_14376:149-397(+)